MGIFAGGDESVIQRTKAVLLFVNILLFTLLLLYGIIQFMPRNPQKKNFTCNDQYHPIIANHLIELNEPLLPRTCHG